MAATDIVLSRAHYTPWTVVTCFSVGNYGMPTGRGLLFVGGLTARSRGLAVGSRPLVDIGAAETAWLRTYIPFMPNLPNQDSICLGIVGLGYVGLPLAVEFGKQLPVIGYDSDVRRVEQIRLGRTLPENFRQKICPRHASYV